MRICFASYQQAQLNAKETSSTTEFYLVSGTVKFNCVWLRFFREMRAFVCVCVLLMTSNKIDKEQSNKRQNGKKDFQTAMKMTQKEIT